MFLTDLLAIVRRSPAHVHVFNLSMSLESNCPLRDATCCVKSIVTLHATKEIEQDDGAPR